MQEHTVIAVQSLSVALVHSELQHYQRVPVYFTTHGHGKQEWNVPCIGRMTSAHFGAIHR